MPNTVNFHGTLLLVVTLFLNAAVSAQPTAGEAFMDMPEGFEVIKNTGVPWQNAAEFAGVQVANIYGNPNEEGFYVIRVRFTPGNMSSPHFHDQDRLVTVLKGTWWVGLSNDLADIQPLEEGGFMVHPAGAVHFDGAQQEETVVEIRGMGPVATTSVPSVGRRDSIAN